MKKLKILSIALILLVGVVCFSACNFNKERVLTYEIVSNTMSPVLEIGDKVKIREKEVYEVGDIIAHKHREHTYISRIIFVFKEGSINFYMCRGDNVQNLDGTEANGEWSDDTAYIQNLVNEGATRAQVLDECGWGVAVVEIDEIKGYVFETIKKEAE